MRRPSQPDTALAPLLDRLVELGPGEPGGEPGSEVTLDEAGLRASVRREVAHILSTRSALPLEQEASREPAERSVLDYGLPDVATLGLESSEGARRLEQLIARAVRAFEPRLEILQVGIKAPTAAGGPLLAVLTARLLDTPAAETLSLPLRLDRSGRLVEVGNEEQPG